MADIFHFYGSDLSISATGDILAVPTGTDESNQRVIRRLLTSKYDCNFDVAYGAGLGGFVGQPVQAGQIEAIVRQNMAKEASVSQTSPSQISLSNVGSGAYELDITYTDSNGVQSQLSLPVGEN